MELWVEAPNGLNASVILPARDRQVNTIFFRRFFPRPGILPLLLSTRQRQNDMSACAMRHARTLTAAAIALLCSTAAAAPLVTYQSPCECLDNHGKQRWAEKNDPAPPPSDASAIQVVTPSDMFTWPESNVHLNQKSERSSLRNSRRTIRGTANQRGLNIIARPRGKYC
jgi:hypothetical protein